MPLTSSAIKKDRQDKKQTSLNRVIRDRIKKARRGAVAKPTAENISKLQSIVDRAAKKNLFNKAHASRVKSRAVRKINPQKTT